MMKKVILPAIEIPNSKVNEFGVTIGVGHFDALDVVIPPLKPTLPFESTVWIQVDDVTAAVVVVRPEETGPISASIPPYALKCCWQTIKYTVYTAGNTEESEHLRVLNEGAQRK